MKPGLTPPDWLQWGRGLVTTEIMAKGARLSAGGHLLQWGRGLVTTEILRPDLYIFGLVGASMGPWPGDHGNERPDQAQVSTLLALQWGRGLVTTEIYESPVAPCFN